MQFSILGSSSSGNSGLLITENCKALVDIGFSCKRICQMLDDRGVAPEEIDVIFITHEHSDHTTGISTFVKKYNPAVYANLMTAKAVQPKLKHKPDWKIFNTGATFQFRDLTIESFSVPHDAHDPVGFKFTSGRGDDLFSPIRSLAWLTDLGFAPQHIGDRIKDVDTLIVEANYCPQLLERDENGPGRSSSESADAMVTFPIAPLAHCSSPSKIRVGARYSSPISVATAIAATPSTMSSLDFANDLDTESIRLKPAQVPL